MTVASKIVIDAGGTARGVYDDLWRPLFEALSGGKLVIERATEIEYDEGSGDWVATLLKTGQVIARGRNRNDVIKEEVAYLERNVIV